MLFGMSDSPDRILLLINNLSGPPKLLFDGQPSFPGSQLRLGKLAEWVAACANVALV
jgi:hypothetical protein